MASKDLVASRIRKPRRWLWLWPASLALLLLLICVGIAAATIVREPESGSPAGQLLEGVGIDPHENSLVPLDVHLRDEHGDKITLRDACGGKPTIVALVYYRCPMLCNLVLDGLVRGLKNVSQDAGAEFNVVAISFDPQETAETAAGSKQTAIRRYQRAGTDAGWHFLTGDEDQVRRVADAIGFHYRYDQRTDQYAHAACLAILNGEGRITRYLYGVEYPARDLRLALTEASTGNLGSVTDRVLLLCYHYDPTTGKYGLAIVRILRWAGMATVLLFGGGIGWMLWRERRTEKPFRHEQDVA